jgi:hypothetical protein
MGCGCKNKQTTQLTPQQIQEIEKKKLESSTTIKESIKKTVEKYYNSTTKS